VELEVEGWSVGVSEKWSDGVRIELRSGTTLVGALSLKLSLPARRFQCSLEAGAESDFSILTKLLNKRNIFPSLFF